jgi:dienelactone hydrolase
VFLNDVLPYAALDETREPWRAMLYRIAAGIVTDCDTAAEAAQALNREVFNVLDVHYNTGRKRPNQSPAESMELKMATCTGLSIILVDACRAVGVPARVVGTPLWTTKRGNHTWVEIWDAGTWHYMGADEYDAEGLDRGWFSADASRAIADDWRHAIWATSWKPTGEHFPMVWNLGNQEVAAVNVTDRYARGPVEDAAMVTVYFRVVEKPGGERLALPVEVIDASGEVVGSVTTRGRAADLNDMPMLELAPDKQFTVRLTRGEETVSTLLDTSGEGPIILELAWTPLADSPAAEESRTLSLVREWLALLPEERHLSIPDCTLTRTGADQVVRRMWEVLREEALRDRAEEMAQRVVPAAGKQMRLLERVFGEAAIGERSLWISMHGGGGTTTAVNDRQWHNQIGLYEPDEGIMVAPRAPTDNWNLWHETHIDSLFDHLIENYIACRGVNPNRVYLLGYSAGGDGVYQLAPRMADRFAAAAMMAGHPNDASPLGLRNLPFMIFVGEEDAAYKRNEVAAEWGRKLDRLQANDPGGYLHQVTLYPELGHWMNGRDREAIEWMAQHTRNPWPDKLVWRQSRRIHERFYWLRVPKDAAQAGQVVRAEVRGQTIRITVEGDLAKLTLRLHDALVDLDQPVTVIVDDQTLFQGKVSRSVEAIWRSLQERLDPTSAATSLLSLSW